MAKLIFKRLNAQEREKLYQLSGRKVFFHPDWQAIHGEALQTRGVFEGGELIAGGSVFTFRKFGVKFACNPPYMPYLPVYIRDVESPERIGQLLLLLFNERFIDVRLELNFPPIKLPQEFTFENRPTHRMNIAEGEEKVWSRLNSSKRNQINRAKRESYVIRINENLSGAISCYRDTMIREEMSFPERFFERLLSGDYTHLVYALNVYKNDQLVHSFLTAYDEYEAYNIASGRPLNNKDKFGGSIGQWKAIVQAMDKGIPSFDFCGSSIAGVSSFFAELGGVLEDGVRIKRNMKMINSLQNIRSKFPF